jgi:uncharacterized damage-inducible protein DinB
MNINTLTDLYHHMEWADAAVWSAVLASASGQTDAKLRDYLHHLHVVQRAFLRSWRNELSETTFPTFETAASLMQWGRTFYAEALSYLELLDDERVSQAMPVAWAARVEQHLGRKPETTTMGETLLQVVLHTTYHRGQVNARLRQLDGEPPLTDYIAWVWFGRPAASWPAAANGGE